MHKPRSMLSRGLSRKFMFYIWLGGLVVYFMIYESLFWIRNRGGSILLTLDKSDAKLFFGSHCLVRFTYLLLFVCIYVCIALLYT